jgi:hypothetical protein
VYWDSSCPLVAIKVTSPAGTTLVSGVEPLQYASEARYFAPLQGSGQSTCQPSGQQWRWRWGSHGEQARSSRVGLIVTSRSLLIARLSFSASTAHLHLRPLATPRASCSYSFPVTTGSTREYKPFAPFVSDCCVLPRLSLPLSSCALSYKESQTSGLKGCQIRVGFATASLSLRSFSPLRLCR